MEERYSLGVPGSSLTVREEGARAVFTAELPDDGRGLYKAYLTGAGGQLLLGTLMPDKGKLRLHRGFSVGELRQKGFWPPVGGEARLAFSFAQEALRKPSQPQGWQKENEPARLLGDRLLKQSAGRLERALIRREESGFALAAPWRADGAFPLTPLFCFAKVEMLGKESWAVFHFNEKGCPIFPDGE